MEVTYHTNLTPNQRFLQLHLVSFKNGEKEGSWVFVSRKETPTALNGGVVVPDAVIIYAIRKQGNSEHIVITREFRIPIGGYEYGFPAGIIDKGESPVDAAKRELFEETGLTVSKVLWTSPPIISSAGMSDEAVVVLAVECVGEPTDAHCEEHEDIEVILMDRVEAHYLTHRKDKYANANIGAKAWPFILQWSEGNNP